MIQPKNYSKEIEFLSETTLNFSGAALQTLCREINKKIKLKQRLTTDSLLQMTKMIAEYYKIKLGDESYSELRYNFKIDLNQAFFKSTFKNTVLINRKNETTYGITFIANEKKWLGQKASNYLQIKDRQISISLENKSNFEKIIKFFNLDRKVEKIMVQKKNFNLKNYTKPTLLIVRATSQDEFASLLKLIYFSNQTINQVLFILFFITSAKIMNRNSRERSQISSQRTQYQIKTNSFRIYNKLNNIVGGRVLVDLSKEPKAMQFQIKKNKDKKCEDISRFSLLCGDASAKQALSEIIDYFMMHNVDFIQVLNFKFLVDNNAFTQDAIVSLINKKLDQILFYHKAAIVIELDDLVSINRSFSKNQTGPSENISINGVEVFRSLAIYINKLAKRSQKKQVWVAVIVQTPQLAQMLRKEIRFPQTFEEKQSKYQSKRKEMEQQQKKNRMRTCFHCNQLYTYQENEKEKKCLQHYGLFMLDRDLSLMQNQKGDYLIQEQDASFFLELCNQTAKKEQKMTFKYTCCWKQLGAAGCHPFRHFQGGRNQDNQRQFLRQQNRAKQERHCQILKEVKRKVLLSNQNLSTQKAQHIYNSFMLRKNEPIQRNYSRGYEIYSSKPNGQGQLYSFTHKDNGKMNERPAYQKKNDYGS